MNMKTAEPVTVNIFYFFLNLISLILKNRITFLRKNNT